MSSFIARRCIALAIVLAMPWPCLAQRGGVDTGAYRSETNPNGAGAEPPRLFSGGIMQQLRSVTESVLGTSEDRRMSADRGGYEAGEVSAAPQRRLLDPRGRTYSAEGTPRGDLPPGADADNRTWAGQFLLPNTRLRDQVGLSRQRRLAEPQEPARVQPQSRSLDGSLSGAGAGEPPRASSARTRTDSEVHSDRRTYLGQPSQGPSSGTDMPPASRSTAPSSRGTRSAR